MANQKKELKQARLDERATALRRQADLERRTRNIIIAVFAVLIVGGGGGLYVAANGWPNVFGTPAVSTPLGPDKSVAVTDEGHNHVAVGTATTYLHQPPSSGTHYNQPPEAPRPWGPVNAELPAGDYVHNLEHGGIVLLYTCTGATCDSIYNQVKGFWTTLPNDGKFNEVKFLSGSYSAMSQKFALLAWDRELDLTTFDTKAITDFYRRYVDHGREDVA